jgi:DNA invertase Pin-like site-specific DNA recombinase
MDYTAADPTGDLVANIIDSINEDQSRINGADVSIKMAAKAERGGTSGKGPLGGLNVHEDVDGREVRTLVVDPVCAPLIQAAFQEYATGKYSENKLQEWVTEAGLRTRPTKANPAGVRFRAMRSATCSPTATTWDASSTRASNTRAAMSR